MRLGLDNNERVGNIIEKQPEDTNIGKHLEIEKDIAPDIVIDTDNIGQTTPSLEEGVNLNFGGESSDDGRGVSTSVNICGQNKESVSTGMNIGGQIVRNDCAIKPGNVDECAIVERNEMTVECEFVKGTCKNHGIKGNKKVTSTKKWTKKKHGFGWVTQKKVTYSCPVGLQASSSNQQTSRDSSLSSDLKQGGSYNSNDIDKQVETHEHEPD